MGLFDIPASVIWAWLPWYALGIAVETPVYVILARVLSRKGDASASMVRLVIGGMAGTAVTHPLFVFLWPQVVGNYLAWAISGEILVTLIETFMFYAIAGNLSLKHAGICALAANATSLLAGFLFA